jgi:CheY-like chemotaxis protein
MTEASPSKGNVLLLDDDKFLLDMYSMKFTREGYTVQACLSAEDALSILRGGFNADAIVFDILMPECDGFTFLQKLNAEKLGVSAVKAALTNQSNEDEKARAESLGASHYFIKASMIPSEVVNNVGEAIAENRAKRA